MRCVRVALLTVEEMSRLEGLFQIVIKLDLDVHELVKVEQRANLGRLVMLHVEIQQIKHRFHDGTTMIRRPLRSKLFDLVQVVTRHSCCELHDGHGHA